MQTCDKIQYATQTEAQRAQRGLAKRKGHSTKLYKCPDCGFWHMATVSHHKKMRKHKR